METKEEESWNAVLNLRFKKVIHDSDVLSCIIHNNVDEFKDKSIDEIKACLDLGEDGCTVIGRDTEFGSPDHGRIQTDSVFDVIVPGTDEKVSIILNIEGQSDPYPGYPIGKRAEFYIARMVSSQQGVYFTNDDYGNVRKTYSIWFILRPDLGKRNTVVRYRMRGENVVGNPKNPPVLDTFNVLMVYVGGYDNSLPDEAAFPAALFTKMDLQERQELMKSKFNITLRESIMREVNHMASLGEDTYNHGFKEGSKETASEIVLRLVKEEGWELDRALSFLVIPNEWKEDVETEVRKRL